MKLIEANEVFLKPSDFFLEPVESRPLLDISMNVVQRDLEGLYSSFIQSIVVSSLTTVSLIIVHLILNKYPCAYLALSLSDFHPHL